MDIGPIQNFFYVWVDEVENFLIVSEVPEQSFSAEDLIKRQIQHEFRLKIFCFRINL